MFYSQSMFLCVLFFFFKQKTAYEMRISDWSSDVCSSDLGDDRVANLHRAHFAANRLDDARGFVAGDRGQRMRIGAVDEMQVRMAQPAGGEIGRASCRESVCQYV